MQFEDNRRGRIGVVKDQIRFPCLVVEDRVGKTVGLFGLEGETCLFLDEDGVDLET